jgi:nitrous oxide reductase
MSRRMWLPTMCAIGLMLVGCERKFDDDDDGEKARPVNATPTAGGGSVADQIARERNLSPDDVSAALKTYMPSGRMDEYVLFASGGHSGQVFAIGVPSMRLLKTIAVFTPEPWQGWGFGTGEEILKGGDVNGIQVRWADTHHPGLSETNADYDGQFLFIGDKANARVAVIDLRDFETKQIVKNPLAINDHGGCFVTPNTDYVVEGGQYGTPLGWAYAPIEDYQKSYRGLVTFWKFDRANARIDMTQSFCIELPPYWQDLFDAGKFESDGWCFGNSINTEMATGGIEEGKPPFEAGVSQRDNDYLHIFNWKKAEEVFKAGKVTKMKNFAVITRARGVAYGLYADRTRRWRPRAVGPRRADRRSAARRDGRRATRGVSRPGHREQTHRVDRSTRGDHRRGWRRRCRAGYGSGRDRSRLSDSCNRQQFGSAEHRNLRQRAACRYREQHA